MSEPEKTQSHGSTSILSKVGTADQDAVKFETVLGHKQELRRNFGLFSLASLGFVIAK